VQRGKLGAQSMGLSTYNSCASLHGILRGWAYAQTRSCWPLDGLRLEALYGTCPYRSGPTSRHPVRWRPDGAFSDLVGMLTNQQPRPAPPSAELLQPWVTVAILSGNQPPSGTPARARERVGLGARGNWPWKLLPEAEAASSWCARWRHGSAQLATRWRCRIQQPPAPCPAPGPPISVHRPGGDAAHPESRQTIMLSVTNSWAVPLVLESALRLEAPRPGPLEHVGPKTSATPEPLLRAVRLQSLASGDCHF